ncbi:pyruvate dehydrogenase complex dihydrolipoamide acetyltransferase [Olivibacter sp. SDN3]|uniref:pyruvate dehydrogenase complex dihydrolipoamide acetyltransferase n=1 Tax=Olivibacter sp. SDN3 TaxID=2764720 RepID=UPI001651441F|nr:pyruvate dehydrogenase complex dihydrolipoamide acetyltransferase [Olivibacter sp. SDN3]QNL50896.1 pyruvate dehydrogenase complex dihydrolipoamide acetyltransferase [Olivibacter sp. SDN3]
MAEVVRMPKMSDTMTEGVIAKWHKKVGDKVSSGDLVAEVETDKATMDFESYQEGTLLYIGPKEGEAVPVDAVIAVLGEEGEDYKALLEGGNDKASDNDQTENTDKEETSPEDDDDSVTAESLGATVITMPLLSDTMTEGVIAEWNFKVGDKIKSDDVIADVETDKATMEVTAYAEGTLLHIGVEKGQAAKVNDIIAIVGEEGTDITPLLKKKSSKPAQKEKEEPAQENEAAPVETSAASKAQEGGDATDSRVKASPLARKIAKEKGIDISEIKGSAENGRIIKKDVEAYTPASKAEVSAAAAVTTDKGSTAAVTIPQFIGEESYTEKPVTQMRKTIAKRLSESLFTAPHFYVTVKVDMDSAIAARAKINEVAPVKVSFNDIVIKAVAVALKQHPNVNSSWLGDKIRYNEHVNIGVAIAVDEGLLVPVVRFADGKTLSHISAEVKDYAQRAKAKKLQPKDWEGSTFTVSNLGMFGVDEFTAIINPPDACILAVGGIQQVPVVKNGAIVPGNVMKLTLSCDHRVVDGATGAAFLQTVKSLLEEPVRLLV